MIGTGNTITLYDKAGNPVQVQQTHDGQYAISVTSPDTALLAALLQQIIEELQEIKANQ